MPTLLSITPAVRQACQQELIRVTNTGYGKTLEECLWKWSRGSIPEVKDNNAKEEKKEIKEPPASKKRKKAAQKATAPAPPPQTVDLLIDSHILYEGKFKQLLHNLQLNASVLVEKYSPDLLVWLDDANLAEGTPFASLREESSKRAKRLDEILTISQEAEPKPTIVLPMTSFLKCRRCGSTEVQFDQKQTRSADEGMTSFCTCKNCGSTWKMS